MKKACFAASTCLFLAAFVGSGLAQTGAEKETKPKPKIFELELGVRARMGAIQQHIGFIIPESLRQVLCHPDDYCGQPLITIPYASVDTTRNIFEITGQFTIGARIRDRLTIRGGISSPIMNFFGENFPIDPYTDLERINRPYFREINLQGTPDRGSGRSLVYYAVPRKKYSLPGFLGEVELRISPLISVIAGASVDYTSYAFERGYDRYNALSPLEHRNFVRIANFSPYVGLGLLEREENARFGAIIYAGPIIPTASFAPGFEGVQLHRNGWGFKVGVAGTIMGYIHKNKK
jgi:hypothetical protein